jgi:hypothetical protein
MRSTAPTTSASPNGSGLRGGTCSIAAAAGEARWTVVGSTAGDGATHPHTETPGRGRDSEGSRSGSAPAASVQKGRGGSGSSQCDPFGWSNQRSRDRAAAAALATARKAAEGTRWTQARGRVEARIPQRIAGELQECERCPPGKD